MKDTKEKILIGAFKLFLEYNYEKVTVNDMEEIIGLTRGSIFYHVKNKEHLFKLVIDRFIIDTQRLKNKVEITNISTFEEFIMEYLSGIKSTMERMKSFEVSNIYKGYFSLISQAGLYYPNFNDKLKMIVNEEFETWEKIILQAKNTGELKNDIETSNIVIMFRSSFLGLSFEQSQFMGLDVNALEEYYNYCYKLIKKETV